MQHRWRSEAVAVDSDGLRIGEISVVEAWEEPIQSELANAVSGRAQLKILEIGYGLGMAARQIATHHPAIHYIIEAHPILAITAITRMTQLHNAVVICALWEQVVSRFAAGSFDGILFDAYPMDTPSFDGSHENTMAHVAPFLPEAYRVLHKEGRLGFLDFSTDVHNYYSSPSTTLFETYKVLDVPLSIPSNCKYATGNVGHVIVLEKRAP